VAADYFVMVFRVIYPMVRQSLKISRAFARAADKALSPKVDRNAHVRQILTKFRARQPGATARRDRVAAGGAKLVRLDAALLSRPDAAGGCQPPHAGA